jgi:hypothetical protein
MKEIKQENARNFNEMFPVILTKLEIKSEEGKTHELLSLFKTNRVYKAYHSKDGYFVFPIRNEGSAFSFATEEEDNTHFASTLVPLTVDNFHEHIDHLSDADVEYFNELLDKNIEDEIADRAEEEYDQDLDIDFEQEVIERSNEVLPEEAKSLFKTLNKKDPRLSRALLEFGKYVAKITQAQEGIDKTLMDVMNDSDLGKGAYTAKAMENILRYAKSNEPAAFNYVLRTGLYSLIEMKRNL